MKVRCRRGHIKQRGKNCRTCQGEWEKLKYREDAAYRDRKKIAVMDRYWKEREGQS